MQIREANINDFIVIQSLSIQLGHDCPGNEVRENLDAILKTKDNKIVLAVNDNTGEVIGYIHVQKYRTLYFDALLNILGIVIDDKWRNRGVGSALIKKAEAIAEEFNCKGLRAASSERRIDAHEFYRRNGFNIIKDQKRFIKMLDD